MKLFLDTNIYLSFLGENADLSVLDRLNKFLFKNKDSIELLIPDQLEMELLGNIPKTRSDNFQKLEKLSSESINLSESLEKRTDFKRLLPKARAIGDEYKKICAKIFEDYKKHINKAEKKIWALVKLGVKINATEEIIGRAIQRHARNLPPKGDGKCGDGVNWETIKENVSNDKLIIISKDTDWSDKFDNKTIHPLLKREWKSKTRKSVILYNSLTAYLDQEEGIKKEKIVTKETEGYRGYLVNEALQKLEETMRGNGYFVGTQLPDFPLFANGSIGSITVPSVHLTPVTSMPSASGIAPRYCLKCGSIGLEKELFMAPETYKCSICGHVFRLQAL